MSLKKSRFIKGIILAPDTLSLDGIEGEIKVDSSTGKIQVTLKDGVNPSASREIVTSSQTQTLTNKTLTSPVIDTGVSGTAIETNLAVSASATKLASASAIKTYVDNVAASQNEASEISYSNATSGLTATNVQNAIDEVDGNVDNLVTLSGVALDSTTLGTFTGVTIPDNSTVKSALQAIETSHESHTGASSGVHGVAGSVVGTSDSQVLTNKTIDADLNTISNIENADIKVGANIARSKLASGTANRVVVNDATGVQTDAAAITAARVLISDANGIPTHSTVTSTSLSYLDATSSIQNQLDAKVDESGGTLTNGSVITPARLDVKQDTKANLTTYALTAANGQLCFATDTKEMFQIVDGLLESVGGGAGIGGVDILFSQTFEEAALTDFTQTGLSLSTSSPLHGEISALLTHQSLTNQSFKQIIPVDSKFRGQTMVLRLDSKSSASQGNVVINIYDETNSANLVASEQLQLSNDVNGKKTSVSFTIPETCASLSYTITALPEAGSPTTRIDDIICELAETALLETAVEVPVVTAWQGYTPTFQGFGTPSAIEFEWRQVGENVEIRGKFTAGTVTAVEARVGLPSGLTSSDTSLIPSIQKIGDLARGAAESTDNFHILIEPSVPYVTFSRGAAGQSGISKIQGASLTNGDTLSFFASVPCAGLSATSTKTIPLTQSGLVQEADAFLLARGNAGQSITADVTDIPFIFSSSQNDIGSWSGSALTISESGTYSIDTSVFFTTNATRRLSIYINNVLSYRFGESASGVSSGSITLFLNSNDTISLRSTVSSTLSNDSNYHFLRVSRQGSLKQVSVSSDQKITIPTSELRFEGSSSRGSTDTAIVRFDTIAKLRGDAFTVESDAVVGTRITMKKAGKLDISVSLLCSGNHSIIISKNQLVNTTNASLPSQRLASQTAPAGSVANVSYEGYFEVGDIIRVSSEGNPTANISNSLNLSFQEQDISVSVTNTLPQFSESDSSVRVDTANGYGSTASNKIRRFSNLRDNIGSDITYLDDPANGATFTIRTSGIYNISYSDQATVSTYIGISKNSSQLTTGIQSITVADRLAMGTTDTTSGFPETVSWQGYLQAGDVIRAQTDGGTSSASADRTQFTISKVGKPNVTGVDVTPFVNVPQPDVAYYTAYNSPNGFGSTYTQTPRFLSVQRSDGTGILSYTDSATLGGFWTANKNCKVDINLSGPYHTIAYNIQIYKNQTGASSGTVLAFEEGPANIRNGVSTTVNLLAGDRISFFYNTTSMVRASEYVSIAATALSDQILTAPETFSTDTAALAYSSTYTLATLNTAPVGSYITFTYAINTNTRTQTATRPTQTDADMNANGMLLYTRAYNAASTAAQPAAFAIQIGKGLKGKSLDLYKSAGKVVAGGLDYGATSTTNGYGAVYKDYNELTGILLVDAGYNVTGSNTQREFLFSDVSSQTSGYLVINASKSPALTGVPLLQPRIATLSDVKASGTAGGTATAGSYQTRTLNTLDDPTGIVTSLASNQFTLPAGEYYIEASAPAAAVASNKLRIQNITDGTTSIIGSVGFTATATTYSISSFLQGKVTISSNKTFELQHRVSSTKASDGFGVASSFGDNEIYSVVKITKVK